MELLQELLAWFTDPGNWSGRDAIPQRLLEHVAISAVAVLAALGLALPVGLYVGHTGRGGFAAISMANIGRALPSYALLVMLFALFVTVSRRTDVFTLGPTILAMVALAIPPILTNAYVGLRDVDRELVEAARGMGMRGWQILRNVELPLALPVILAGLRTATTQVVATAALGAVIGSGGLGRYIIQGIARQDDARLLAGALMVGGLAIAADLVLALVQRRIVSAGLNPERASGTGYGERPPARAGAPS